MEVDLTIEQKTDKIIDIIRQVFSTKNAELKVFDPEDNSWLSPRVVSSEYDCTSEQAGHAIYRHAKKVLQATMGLESKDEANTLRKKILTDEVSVMQPSHGSPILVINRQAVENLGFQKRITKKAASLTAQSISDQSLYEAILFITKNNKSFYYSRKNSILLGLIENKDYYFTGNEEHRVCFLTSAGQKKLPDIVAKELRSFRSKFSPTSSASEAITR